MYHSLQLALASKMMNDQISSVVLFRRFSVLVFYLLVFDLIQCARKALTTHHVFLSAYQKFHSTCVFYIVLQLIDSVDVRTGIFSP